MKNVSKAIIFLILLSLCSLHTQAQQYYKWLTGGGSDGEPQNQQEIVTHMCTDDNDNVYVLSLVGDKKIKADTFYRAQAYNISSNLYFRHLLFTSYTCDGKMRFAKLIEARSNTYAHGLVYSNGKVYVAGVMIGDNGKRIGDDAVFTAQYQGGFVAKFDTSGLYEWNRFIGQDVPATFNAVAIYGSLAVDGQGNIHHYTYVKTGVQLMPSVISQTGNYDLKYNTGGTLLSATRLPLADTAYCVTRAEIDRQNNNAYIVYTLPGGTTTRSGTYLAAYTPANTQIWLDTTSIRAGIGPFNVKHGDGIYLIAGAAATYPLSIMGTPAPKSVYSSGLQSVVAKLNINTGAVIWMKLISVSTGNASIPALEVMPNYNIAIAGGIAGTVRYMNDSITTPVGGMSNPFLLIIDTAGTRKVLEQMQGSTGQNRIMRLASTKNNSLYMGGYTEMSIKGGNLTPYVSNGGTDFFVMKYGVPCNCTPAMAPAAAFTWLQQGTSSTAQFTYTGTGTSPIDSTRWDFGDNTAGSQQTNTAHTYSAHGTYTVCVMVYSACGMDRICKDITLPATPPPGGINEIKGDGIGLYPNPVENMLHVKGLPAGASLQVYDMLGVKIYEDVVKENDVVINTSQLPAGTYIMHIGNEDGSRVIKKFVKQ